jgi:hypothetical protein
MRLLSCGPEEEKANSRATVADSQVVDWCMAFAAGRGP